MTTASDRNRNILLYALIAGVGFIISQCFSHRLKAPPSGAGLSVGTGAVCKMPEPPPLTHIPFWSRLLFGMSFGLFPIWRISKPLRDVEFSAMSAIMLSLFWMFMASLTTISIQMQTGVEAYTQAASWIIWAIGFMVICGVSLRLPPRIYAAP